MTTTLTDHNYYSIIKANKIVLVDWYADWCQPCQRFLNILPRVEQELGPDVVMCKINVDQNADLSDKMNITKIPTFILYIDGVEQFRWVGIETINNIKKIISRFVKDYQ